MIRYVELLLVLNRLELDAKFSTRISTLEPLHNIELHEW